MADPGRVCVFHGAVVDGKNAVPADPSDFSPPDDWESRGCNRLRCDRCGAMVRNKSHVEGTEDIRDRAAELHATDDWLTLPYIKESGSWRLYACTCTVFLAGRSHVMHDPDDFDPLTDTSFHWRCAGHPQPSLPLAVDGETVARASDVQRLVDKVLSGWIPPAGNRALKDVPPRWLGRLYTRLRGLPEADLVGRTVAAHAFANKGKELGVALLFFERFPGAAGADGVVAHLAKDLKAASKSHVVRPATYRISQSAPEFLANVGSPTALSALHRVLLEGGKAPKPALLEAVGARDGEWLAGEAVAVLGGRHRLVRALLDALAATGRWELVTVAGISLVGEGGDVGAAAGRWAKDSAVRDRAAAIAIRGAAEGL